MSTESITLLESTFTESANSDFSYGGKKKGAGYHKNSDGVHTVIYQFNNFIGTVKIQGTLALYPGEADWVDVDGTTIDVLDSSALNNDETRTFTGKFVWIRAAYTLQNGTITEIRYNH